MAIETIKVANIRFLVIFLPSMSRLAANPCKLPHTKRQACDRESLQKPDFAQIEDFTKLTNSGFFYHCPPLILEYRKWTYKSLWRLNSGVRSTTHVTVYNRSQRQDTSPQCQERQSQPCKPELYLHGVKLKRG